MSHKKIAPTATVTDLTATFYGYSYWLILVGHYIQSVNLERESLTIVNT